MKQTVSSDKKNAVIVSSYKYDHPYTDMACAWSTVYKIFEIDSQVIRDVDCVTGCGETLEKAEPELNIIEMTDEIRALYESALLKKREEVVKSQFERYQKELDEYNSKFLPQRKGQIVEILDGRTKGYVGKVTWFGKSKFNNAYSTGRKSVRAAMLTAIVSQRPYEIPNADCDLIAIRPLESEMFPNGKSIIYINPVKAKVVEGYDIVKINEDRLRYLIADSETFIQKWRNAY